MHIEDLKTFKTEHGHCNVPRTFRNQSLARFVSRTRLEHGQLEDRRVKVLVDLGFVFDVRGGQWESRYNELAKILEEKRKSGEKAIVTKKENKSLNRWLGYQREENAKFMRNDASTMTEEKAGLLQEIGVVLNPTGKLPFDGSGSAGAASASEKSGKRNKEANTDQETSINVNRPAIDYDHPHGQAQQLQQREGVTDEAGANADRPAIDDGDPKCDTQGLMCHLKEQLQRKEVVTKEVVTDKASTPNVDRSAIGDNDDSNDDLQNRGTCEEIDPVLLKRMNTLSVALNGEIDTGGGKSWADLVKEAHERVEVLRKLGLHLSNPDLREEYITRGPLEDGEQCIDPVYTRRANALSAVLGCSGNDAGDSEAVSAQEAKLREDVLAKFLRLLSNPPLLGERIERSPPQEGEAFIRPDILEKQRHLSRLIEEGDKAKVDGWIAKNKEKQEKTWEEEGQIIRANANVPANLPEGPVHHDSKRHPHPPFPEEVSSGGDRLPWTRQPWSHPDDDGSPVPTSTYIQRANDLTAGLYRYPKETERGGRPTNQEVDKLVRLERFAEKEGRTLKRQKILYEEAVTEGETKHDEFDNETDEERQVQAREERAVRRFFYLLANYDTIVKKSTIQRALEEGETRIDPATLGKTELLSDFLFDRDGICLLNEWYQGTADAEGRPTMPPEVLEKQRKFNQALVDSLRKWRIHLCIDFCPWDQAGVLPAETLGQR